MNCDINLSVVLQPRMKLFCSGISEDCNGMMCL